MVLSVMCNQKANKAKGRTMDECAPTGMRPYGTQEAIWDGAKWVALPAWLDIVILDLTPAAEDYQVEIATKFGTLTAWASEIRQELISGS